jgi:hypothetical protein
MRFARTTIRQRVPTGTVCRGVNRYRDADDRLSAKPRERLGGHAKPKARTRARTASLNRTETRPPAEIETDTTRGAGSADDGGSKSVSHPVPPATDTPKARPNGPAIPAAAACLQPPRKRSSLVPPPLRPSPRNTRVGHESCASADNSIPQSTAGARTRVAGVGQCSGMTPEECAPSLGFQRGCAARRRLRSRRGRGRSPRAGRPPDRAASRPSRP